MTPRQIGFFFPTFSGNTLQSRGKAGVTGAFSTYSCFSAVAGLVVIHHLLPLCSLTGPCVTWAWHLSQVLLMKVTWMITMN